MTGTVELHLLGTASSVPMLQLGAHPRWVGRAPDNDLVLTEGTVSSRHASMWVERGAVWLRDDSSKNGTFVNDKRIKGTVPVEAGDVVRFGGASRLIVRGTPDVPDLPRHLLVEDIDHNVRFPIHGTRFRISSASNADIPVDDQEAEAQIFVRGDEVWLGTMDDEGVLDLETPFEVGGRKFRVISMAQSTAPTVDISPAMLPYRLSVTLNGVTGPEATLEDPNADKRHVICAENRAILLYVLATRGKEGDSDGWCADEDVSRDIWGRKASPDSNGLHVLIHRLRREIKTAGFDPWFIEKRRKAVRLTLSDIDIV